MSGLDACHLRCGQVDQYNTKKHGTAYNNAEWVSRPNWCSARPSHATAFPKAAPPLRSAGRGKHPAPIAGRQAC